MTEAIVMTMTDAGRLTTLDYVDSGFNVKFSHVAVGTGNHTATNQTTKLKTKWADFPIISGYHNKETHCLMLTAMGQIQDIKAISELALYDDEGELIAVVAKPKGYYFKTEPDTFFSFNISISLTQDLKDKTINLSFAPQEQIVQALLKLHLQHKNPHPQYFKYMQAIMTAHVNDLNPHNQYAMRTEFAAQIQSYTDYVNRLITLFLGLFGKFMYAGRYKNPGTSAGYEITLGNDHKGTLLDTSHAVFVTPESSHEGWSITRKDKSISCYTFERSVLETTGYNGAVNWIVLNNVSDSPVSALAIPELLATGIGVPNSKGVFSLKSESTEITAVNDLCLLVCPEQQHEGWEVERNQAKRTLDIHPFRRNKASRTTNIYKGPINYALLAPSDGTSVNLSGFFPCLLMSGVYDLAKGAMTIKRPSGQDWDLTNPNFVVILSPDCSHEGWTIKRSKDRIDVNVYERDSNNERIPAAGRCNFALFQKEQLAELYLPGTYEILIPANSTIEVQMVGASGSGAGSLWASNYKTEWLQMDHGQDSSFTIKDQVNIVAGGGKGGTRGAWNNGSAYLQGVAGDGGKAQVNKQISTSILAQKDGVKAYLETAPDWCNRDTRGGPSVWEYGGPGGEGGYTVETRKHRCYGGGGGSAAYIKLSYANTTANTVKATLVVGAAGRPDTITPELNNGKAGSDGAATVTIKRLG